MTFSDLYSNKTNNLINQESSLKTNQIFVFLGQAELIDTTNLIEYISDPETFILNGNEELFNKIWFAKVFTTLNSEKRFHLITYAQFSYLINYIDSSFFKDRIIIVRDNLRQLFPINKVEYLKFDDCGTFSASCTIMNLDEDDVIVDFLKSE